MGKYRLLSVSRVYRGQNRYICSIKILVLFGIILYLAVLIWLNANYFDGKKTAIARSKCNYGPNGPKIYCAVVTHYMNLPTKALAVQQTWGQRCDKLIFATGQKPSYIKNPIEVPKSLNIVYLNTSDSYFNLTSKTLSMLRYVHETTKPGDFDWLLKADDDTYVIMENLKSFLNDHCPNETRTYGFNMKMLDREYQSGGAGYTISSSVVHKLGDAFRNNNRLCESKYGIEDVEVAMCLKTRFDVTLGDSRDELGRERFHPTNLKFLWTKPAFKHNFWLEYYAFYPLKYGADCCSPTSITFHYVNDQEMRQLELLLYRLKPVDLNSIVSNYN